MRLTLSLLLPPPWSVDIRGKEVHPKGIREGLLLSHNRRNPHASQCQDTTVIVHTIHEYPDTWLAFPHRIFPPPPSRPAPSPPLPADDDGAPGLFS